jgi:hypothetical protein
MCRVPARDLGRSFGIWHGQLDGAMWLRVLSYIWANGAGGMVGSPVSLDLGGQGVGWSF